jgi:subtilisin family serine protease
VTLLPGPPSRHRGLVLALLLASPLAAIPASAQSAQRSNHSAPARVSSGALIQDLASRARIRSSERESFALRHGLVPGGWLSPNAATGLPSVEFELFRIQGGHPVYRATHNFGAGISVRIDGVRSGGWLGTDFQGQNQIVGVWDAHTALPEHVEFGGRIQVADVASTPAGHATHVSGTIAASGVRLEAQGVAPAVAIEAHDWQNDDVEMASAGAQGLLVSNHSYGTFGGWVFDLRRTGRWAWMGNLLVSPVEDFRYGYYGDEAANWDAIAEASPNYVIVKSAGNERADQGPTPGTPHDVFANGWEVSSAARQRDGGTTGYDTILDSGISKNVLTIGAVEDLPGGYASPLDVRMTTFSGWGPTDDGRVKPDLVATGTSLLSPVAGDPSSYAFSSGTSMSTPVVSGVVALVQQAFRELLGRVPSSATVRALLIHSAAEAGLSEGPDYRFGWGLVDAAAAVSVVQDEAANGGRIVGATLLPGQSISFALTLAEGADLEATLVWTDPPAPPSTPGLNTRTSVLVNDLDLRIEGNGDEFFPYLLDPADPDAAATHGINSVDTVERVYASGQKAGAYTATVSLSPSAPSGQQFSLVMGPARRGAARGGWLSGRLVTDGEGIPRVSVRAIPLDTALSEVGVTSASDGSFLFPDLAAGTFDVVPDPAFGFTPDTLRLSIPSSTFAEFRGSSLASVSEVQLLQGPDLLRATEWASNTVVGSTVAGGVYGMNVFVDATPGLNLNGGRLVAAFEAVSVTGSYGGAFAQRFRARDGDWRLSRVADGRYFKRVPVFWQTPGHPPGSVVVPVRILDSAGRLVGRDSLRWELAGGDDQPPLVYPRLDIEGRGLAIPGKELIIRTDILDGSPLTEVTALMQDRDNGSFVASARLYDDGQWSQHADAVAGDRLFGTVFRPTSEADYRMSIRAVDANANVVVHENAWHFSSRPFRTTAPYLLMTWSENDTGTDLYRAGLRAGSVAHDVWEFDVRGQIPDSIASSYQAVLWAWKNRRLARAEDHAVLAALLDDGQHRTPVVLLGSKLASDQLEAAAQVYAEGSVTGGSGGASGAVGDSVWANVHLDLTTEAVLDVWSGANSRPLLTVEGRAVAIAGDGLAVSGLPLESLEPGDAANFLRRLLFTVTGDPNLSGVATGAISVDIPQDPYLGAPYPNPAMDAAYVELRLNEPAFVSANIYDMTGRRVAILSNSQLPAGLHSLTWDVSRAPAGVYFVSVTAGGFRAGHPLVVVGGRREE